MVIGTLDERGLGERGPAQAPHRCTKCNSPPINGQCIILFDMALYNVITCAR